jgi:cytochrome oxidase Cu insertion factor (SCO1/SenC/PrrC family)
MCRPPARRLFLLLLSVALAGVLSCSGGDRGLDAGPVGDFKLKERDGRTVGLDDLRGKVWVASFIFTRCTGPCPQVTGTVARLQGELKLADVENLRLVTFTVDPERDNPAELREYAQKFQADEKRWLFLTGKKEEIHRLLIDSFKVPVEEAPEKEKKPGEEFAHSTRLVVVDKAGHIRGYFDGMPQPTGNPEEDAKDFEANLTKLSQRVKELLREKPR